MSNCDREIQSNMFNGTPLSFVVQEAWLKLWILLLVAEF